MPDKWNLDGVSVDATDNMTITGNLTIVGVALNIANIPTSASGLSSGDVWSNSGILTIVT